MNRTRMSATRAGWLIASSSFLAASSVHAATITVTTTAQEPGGMANGNCTLGEAVRAANGDTAVDGCTAGSGDDVIMIPAGTFVIDVAEGTTVYGGPTALPRLTSSVTLQGAGSTATIIRPAATAAVFGFVQPNPGSSARERQVAAYAALGHAHELVAYELGLTVSTVRTHEARAMAKLGVDTRAALVRVLAPTVRANSTRAAGDVATPASVRSRRPAR